MGVLLLAGGMGLTGCDDPMAADARLAPQPATASIGATAPGRFVSNAIEYRNSSARPAVGRAGSATLSAHALADASGETELVLAAGTLGDGEPRLGVVQMKAFEPEGRLLYTRVDAPGPLTRTGAYVLGGLGRGARVQVQAKIDGADAARAGVVTVDVPVRLRPDLTVGDIAAPQRVGARTMVGISATVRELNGDFGARADCALYVEGVQVDRAYGIWVDAGSAVSCAFRHRFDEVGKSEVEVRALGVEPRDYDPANNAARATVNVILVPSAFVYDAAFADVSFEHTSRWEWGWTSADGRFGYEVQDASAGSGREQFGFLWGWAPHGLTFPLNELMIRQMTRDELVHAARYIDVDADWSWSDEWGSQACISRWFDTPNGFNGFDLCSVQWEGSEPHTYVHYSRYAGEVTYHSRGDARWWDLDAGYEDAYSWNYSFAHSVGRMVSYGREYSFFVYIDDGSGVYRMQPLVWLQPFTEEYQSPWSCWDYTDEWGSARGCHEFRWKASGLREWVSGWPTY